jgi:hypothetical protein
MICIYVDEIIRIQGSFDLSEMQIEVFPQSSFILFKISFIEFNSMVAFIVVQSSHGRDFLYVCAEHLPGDSLLSVNVLLTCLYFYKISNRHRLVLNTQTFILNRLCLKLIWVVLVLGSKAINQVFF